MTKSMTMAWLFGVLLVAPAAVHAGPPPTAPRARDASRVASQLSGLSVRHDHSLRSAATTHAMLNIQSHILVEQTLLNRANGTTGGKATRLVAPIVGTRLVVNHHGEVRQLDPHSEFYHYAVSEKGVEGHSAESVRDSILKLSNDIHQNKPVQLRPAWHGDSE